MSLLTKIFTALRGGARELGETIVDHNGVRIFEQEIKDAETALDKAKRDLTEVMAQEMQVSRKIESLSTDVAKHEDYAAKALEQGNEALALDIAQKIADIQSELDIQKQAQANFAAHVTRLKNLIKQTSKALADMQRQLVMVKTTQNVQKATTAITQNYASGSSKLLTAKESLDRIKVKQQNMEDRLKAGELLQSEFDGQDLEKKLKEAGIVQGDHKAQEILANLKAKKNG
ncbi:MAG: PspA/IM30 family protein [Alphaproteobacteria bacterium]|nr:MAG: PspA/IM30 family protein [Alphaproteobacteria bacterium]